MDGLLLLLVLIGASFFVMTRFAGGSHMARGHEGECCGSETTQKIDQIDPVCGNVVSDSQGYNKSYDGHEYRFCSRECLDEFEATPEKFSNHDERGEATLVA